MRFECVHGGRVFSHDDANLCPDCTGCPLCARTMDGGMIVVCECGWWRRQTVRVFDDTGTMSLHLPFPPVKDTEHIGDFLDRDPGDIGKFDLPV